MDAGSKAPRRLGDYELGERLGAGGMGTVYAGRHVETGARYALKVLSGANPTELLRFQREAEGQARVDAHPNIVRVHSFEQVDGRAFLVMDLIEGGALEDRLRAGRPTPEQAAGWVRDLASAVEHAHQRGVFHRDIKPGNVLFDGERPLLVDFGLAKLTDARSLTETGAILGTPQMMAPEQVEPRLGQVGPETDVYGLGALLYWCLTGQPPFGDESTLATLATVVKQPPRPPRELAPDVPAALEQVCLRCLEKEMDRRYPSAEALARALDEALATPERRSRAGFAVAGALVGLAAASSVLVAVVAHSPAGSPRDTPAEPPRSTSAPAPHANGSRAAITTLPPLPSSLPESRLPESWLLLHLDIDQARALDREGEDRAAVRRYRIMLSHPRTALTSQVLRRLALTLSNTPDPTVRDVGRGRVLLVRAALLGEGKATGHLAACLVTKTGGFETLPDERERRALAAAARELRDYWNEQRPTSQLRAAKRAYRKLWETFPEAREPPAPVVEPPTERATIWSRPPPWPDGKREEYYRLRKSDPSKAGEELVKLLRATPSRGHAPLYRDLAAMWGTPEQQAMLLARAALVGDGMSAATLAAELDPGLEFPDPLRWRLGLPTNKKLAQACRVLWSRTKGDPMAPLPQIRPRPSAAEGKAAYRELWLAFPHAR